MNRLPEEKIKEIARDYMENKIVENEEPFAYEKLLLDAQMAEDYKLAAPDKLREAINKVVYHKFHEESRQEKWEYIHEGVRNFYINTYKDFTDSILSLIAPYINE